MIGLEAGGVDANLGEGQLFGDDLIDEFGGDEAAVFEVGVVVDPLPELGAADLGGGGVLHQVEEWNAADAAQPRFEIAEADGYVEAEAGVGKGAFWNPQKI